MSNVAATSNSSLGAITNQNQFNSSYTQFLSMLTTELQNQDPTSPMDATQFTNQLVGFSQLEQQLQTNSNLQTLISNQSATGLSGSLGYLGHTVLASGDAFAMPEDGSTTINYSLPQAAASASMTVTDAAGQVMGSIPVPTNSGSNSFAFDGSLPDGTDLPAGQYTYAITAASATGQAITATTYTSGVVTAIDTSAGAPVLSLGALSVNASNVVAVTS
jgi:flagellar basal-body rod modification protein FlgD